MQSTELGRNFLARVSEYLVSLPFDLKILQEAVADPDLERSVRETAANVLINSLSPQEGPSPERYVDDVLFLRLAFSKLLELANSGSEAAVTFCARFEDVFERVPADVQLFERYLGAELWTWLGNRLTTLSRSALSARTGSPQADTAAHCQARSILSTRTATCTQRPSGNRSGAAACSSPRCARLAMKARRPKRHGGAASLCATRL